LALLISSQFNVSAQKALLVTPTGHTETVTVMAYSPDNRILVTGSEDQSARIWDLEQKRLLYVLTGQSGSITSVGFSPGSKKIITAAADGSACIWETWNGLKLRCLPIQQATIRRAGFLKQGTLVFTETHEPKAEMSVWDAQTGELKFKLKGRTDATGYGFEFTNTESSKITTYTEEGEVFIYDLSDGQIKHRILGQSLMQATAKGVFGADTTQKTRVQTKKYILGSVFTADGEKLLTTNADSTIKVWNVFSGKNMYTLPDYSSGFSKTIVHPKKNQILTVSGGKSLRLWNLENTELAREWQFNGYVQHARFAPEGNEIIVLRTDGTVYFVPCEANEPRLELPPAAVQIRDMDIRSDYQQVAFLGYDGNVRLLHPSNGAADGVLKGSIGSIYSGAISKNGVYLAVGGADSMIRIYDNAQGKLLKQFRAHEGEISSLQFNLQGDRLLSTSTDMSARIWDIPSGRKLQTVHSDGSDIMAAEFHPDGLSLATGSMSGKIVLSRSDDGLPLLEIHEKGDPIHTFLYSHDGSLLAVAERNGTCKLYSGNGSELLKVFQNKGAAISLLRFSPDNKTLAAGMHNGEVILLDVDSFFPQQRIKGASSITSLVFNKRGDQLFFGTDQREAVLVDLKSMHSTPLLPAPSFNISQAVFSYNDEFLFTGAENGAMATWSASSGGLVHIDLSHRARITSLFTEYNQPYLYSTSQDGSIKVWNQENGKNQLTLLGLTGKDQMVIHHSGLFDLTEGAAAMTHFVVSETNPVSPPEIIELNQLKYRYFEPGLWSRARKKESMRNVASLDTVQLWPNLKIDRIDDNTLWIRLTARNGGIGPVQLYVRGRELSFDLRPDSIRSKQNYLEFLCDLRPFEPIMIPDTTNMLQIYVWNKDKTTRSRPMQIPHIPSKQPMAMASIAGDDQDASARGAVLVQATAGRQGGSNFRPKLYALCVGVSDYTGDHIDLTYAAKDAEDFADALRSSASKLLGAESVQVTVLNTSTGPQSPSRKNILNALAAMRSSRPGDIVLVYLSGHGISKFEEFYFMSAEASEAVGEYLSDREFAKSVSISSDELTTVLNSIPADKKVLIIDACNSGKATEKMAIASRDMPSSQIRALDRMQGRSGMWVLAGSAADMPSYEASRFGQGLLTYSLLKGIKGAALREDGEYGFVDISTLFNFCTEEVPRLAKEISGIQVPQFMSPTGAGSFDIGMLTDSLKKSIKLAEPKPVFIKPKFQLYSKLTDDINLTRVVSGALADLRSKGKDAPISYIESGEYPEAHQIGGTYEIAGEFIKADVYVWRNGTEELDRFTVDGEANEAGLRLLAQRIVERARQKI